MPSTASRPAEIVAVRDETNRDLLLAPQPLIIAGPERATVRIEIGPGGPMQIRVSADQSWLQFDHSTLDVADGGAAELLLSVLSERTDEFTGGEFAVLRLGWAASGEACAEHVLIWRKARPQRSDSNSPHSVPALAPQEATTPLPDWLKGSG